MEVDIQDLVPGKIYKVEGSDCCLGVEFISTFVKIKPDEDNPSDKYYWKTVWANGVTLWDSYPKYEEVL